MDQATRQRLPALLDELRGAIEDLLLAGLTTASKSSVERLDVTFKEASRMKLLRLGSTLRIANEEVSRFTAGAPQFSARRLAFFLGRAWLLATAMRKVIDAGDDAAFDQLMATPAATRVATLKVVTLGVTKRVVPGAFAAFDFRLRAIEAAPPVEAGAPLVWSFIFPMRPGLELPAEAFLHLPQKQKFKPSLLLEKKIVEVQCGAVSASPTPGGPWRLTLIDEGTVQPRDAFTDWAVHWKWDPQQAAARLAAYRTTPLDLEVELQEEVFLDAWEGGAKQAGDDAHDRLPIQTPTLPFEARLDRGPSGVPLSATMESLAAKKNRPQLFGLVHYESCRLVLQPLTALSKDGPTYLTVSPDKISQAELVKAMKFT